MLTDRHVRSLLPGPKARDLRDTEHRGLIVRVLPSGVVQFSLRYRSHGQQRRFKLGTYPSLSLAAARKRARQIQHELDTGLDPAAVQRAARAPRIDTVAALANDYLTKHARKFKKSAAEDERILTRDVLPAWSDRSVRDLTRRDVRALVEGVVERGAPVMANRTLAVVRRLLNFAIDHDWIEANPAARVRKPAPETSRDRVLDDDEIRQLWRLLTHFPSTADRPAPGRKARRGSDVDPICPVSERHAAVLKLRLITAQRGGEVAQMRWQDLDLEAGWWTIPELFTKNGKPHRVPLVDPAIAIIRVHEPERTVAGGRRMCLPYATMRQ